MIKKSFVKICSLFACGFLFASCNDFLSGSELKNEIDENIAYANLPSVTIRVAGDDSVKFISDSGDIVLKATDTKEIEFELVSEDYYFADWSVVKKNDQATDGSSYIDIQTINGEKSFKTNVTIKKGCPDLLLKPVTKLKPGVFSASPAYYPTGVSFFKAVTLTFTQPMKNADLENWTHVKITDKNGNSIKENFNIPELSEDGKILTIVPVASKISKLLEDVQTFEIKISVDGGLSDVENSGYVTKPFTHTYVINKPVDDAPPVLTEINISKEIINLETREKTLIPINQNGFDEEWSIDELENHHTNGSIFINCKGTDNSSGIKALKVTETLIKEADGSDGSGTLDGSCGNFIEKTEGIFDSGLIKYDLKTRSDGIIQVDFELVGYNEKLSNKETFYVIKDTKRPNIQSFLLDSDSYREYFLHSVKENGLHEINSFYFILSYLGFYKENYEPVYITIKYWDEGDEGNQKDYVTNLKCEADNLNSDKKQSYDLIDKFLRNPQKNIIIKIIAETKYGNSVENVFKIDKTVKFCITGSESVDRGIFEFDAPEHRAKVTFDSLPSCSSMYFYYQYKKNLYDTYEDGLKSRKYYNDLKSNEVKLDPGFYKFYLQYKNKGNFLVFADDTIEFQVTDEGNVKSLKNNGSVTVNDSDWPKISNVNISDGGPNSGVCNVKYDYSFAGNPEYDFRVKFIRKTGNQEIVTGNIDETFVLESGYSTETGYMVSSIYEPYFLCFDKSGILLADSRDKNIDYSDYIIDIRDVHNLPFDADDLSFSGINESSPVNAVFKVLSYFDNPDVEQKITYYVVKNKESLALMTYSDALVKNLPEYTFEPGSDFITAGKQTSVPVEVPENGYYTIFAKVKDKYGNYGIKNGFFSSYVGGELDLSKISVDSNIITLPDEKAYGSYCYYYEDGEWKQNDGVESAQTENNEFNLTVSDGYKNKFVKLVSYSDAGRHTGATGPFRNYNKTVYLYPDYYLNNLKIRNKGMMELKNGYQLFIDQPAFVRVLYSKTNWGDDADLWGTRGFETDCRVENETFTYTPNIREVPSGYYYCTVVHFADGTSAMGTVLKKP